MTNDSKNSHILNTYYLLTMLSAEKCYDSVSKQPQKAETWPPSFIQRNFTSEKLVLTTAPYFSRKETGTKSEGKSQGEERLKG